MAHRSFIRASKDASHVLSEMFGKPASKQNFKHLLVLDFEATCEENNRLDNQEIIEFPCVALSTEDWKVKDVFHEYVKPRVNSELSVFCTELTGILQEMVEDQPHFPEIFENFNKWLKEGGYLENESSAFVTSGDWDLKIMLPNQCQLDKIPVPIYFNKWIDLKKTFCTETKVYPRGLKGMAQLLNMPFTGKLHSGINDVHNMVQFIIKLNELHKTNFTINSWIDKPVAIS